MQKSNNKIVSKEAPEYDFAQLHIQGPYTDTPGFFFHSFCCWTFASCMNRERLINNVSMFHFLDTNIREKKKYEMRIQISVHDLRYDVKFENCLKDKNNFFIKQNIAFLSWTKIYFILGDICF